MKIFLTFDYELFFGSVSGSVERCLLLPTNDLLKLAEKKNVQYTFFVDIGFIIQAEKYPELQSEVEKVKNQLQDIIAKGHDIQLHIHPHWEKAIYANGKWVMNTKGAYKFSDFSLDEIEEIFTRYKNRLESLINRKVEVYRAGGWCVQPFSLIKDICIRLNIVADSSVFVGGYLMTEDYQVDFTDAPSKSKYRFEDDVCVEDVNGRFIEFPISSYRYSPSFYWQLYGLGKLFPKRHKMIGDGKFISQGGRKLQTLTNFTNNHVSSDGYYAKKLNQALLKSLNLGHEEMVVIGHPKGNTSYSLSKLKNFIELNQNNHCFTTFPDK